MKRLIRVFKAWVGKLLNILEDPETILRNNIVEMKERIPQLNLAVAKAYGSVIMLKNQLTEYEREEVVTRGKLKIAIKKNLEGIGQNLALQLDRIVNHKTQTSEALVVAKKGLSTMKDIREVQLNKIKQEVEKIEGVIEEARLTKIKGDVAEMFESFTVNDVSYSNTEMIDALKKESSIEAGKFESISDSMEIRNMQVEKELEDVQAKESYAKYKKQFHK